MPRTACHIEPGRSLDSGVERVRLVHVEQTEPFLKVRFQPLPLPVDQSPEIEALQRAIVDLAARVLELVLPAPPENYPDILGQTLRLSFSCKEKSACE